MKENDVPGVLQPGDTQRMLLALALLQTALPVEQRLKAASDGARAAYGTILTHWVSWGAPPTADTFDPAVVEELERIDAVVRDAKVLSCYPFSSAATGISVEYMGRVVSATCAIDALAIARLVRVPILISSHCVVNAEAIRLIVKSDGSIPARLAGAAGVVIKVPRNPGGTCARTFCPGIRFVSATEASKQPGVLTLPEAAAVAAALFGFQRALLPA